MNTSKRVTLSAFGTSGVLLAASLTMLAMVSALVTFDAWPTRGGSALAGTVAVEPAPAARLVRAVRHAVPVGGARALAARRAGTTLAAGGGAGATGAAAGGVALTSVAASQTGSGTLHTAVYAPAGPAPGVPSSPPGEGDPGPGIPPPRPSAPSPVHSVVCGAASGRISGVVGEAVGC